MSLAPPTGDGGSANLQKIERFILVELSAIILVYRIFVSFPK